MGQESTIAIESATQIQREEMVSMEIRVTILISDVPNDLNGFETIDEMLEMQLPAFCEVLDWQAVKAG